MRKHHIVGAVAGAILGFLGIGAASAADLSPPPPVEVMPGAAPILNWTGFYIGVNGGGGVGSEDCTSCSTDANDFSISGPFVGAQVGYNWQNGSVLLGLEGDIQWSGIDGQCNGSVECNGPPQLTVHDLDWFGTVRGRLGWVNGNWMPYLTGGVAFGSGTRHTSSGIGDTGTASHTGWTVGAGIEYALNNNWSAKLEYQYIDLGTEHYDFPNIGGSNPDVSLTAHTFRIGLNRHF